MQGDKKKIHDIDYESYNGNYSSLLHLPKGQNASVVLTGAYMVFILMGWNLFSHREGLNSLEGKEKLLYQG